MIPLTCDECDKSLKLRDELAGKKIKCPGCGASLLVPDGDDDEQDERITAAPAKSRRHAPRDDGDDDDAGPSKPHPVFLIVGMLLALFGLVTMAGSIVLNHRNNNSITELQNEIDHDNRQLAGEGMSKDQRESLTASIKRKTDNLAGLQTSRYMAFAVVFGVIFLLGVGLRGYYFIAMKAYKAAHPEEEKPKKGKKKKKRREE